ncbi:MAG: DedA family protein [Gammaproteobacteria bacterium]|nr:DedA family protein [Gammaproteobacteria bacterium]
MFRKLYNKVLAWAEHPLAVRSLMGLSFIEAFCFPIPPDVMLAPMTMAKPQKAWYYALITTLCSVLGGVLGYFLGLWAFHLVAQPILEYFNAMGLYQKALFWFDQWGICIVLIAAFTPVPYKLFTIAAGAMQMNLPLFILVSLLGRGTRFFLVCSLFKFGNKYLSQWIQRWIDAVGWGALILIIIGGYLLFR